MEGIPPSGLLYSDSGEPIFVKKVCNKNHLYQLKPTRSLNSRSSFGNVIIPGKGACGLWWTGISVGKVEVSLFLCSQ